MIVNSGSCQQLKKTFCMAIFDHTAKTDKTKNTWTCVQAAAGPDSVTDSSADLLCDTYYLPLETQTCPLPK